MAQNQRKAKAEERAFKEELNLIQVQAKKLSLPFALGMGLLVFLVYYLTLFRTVPGGDSGELIAVAYRMGVAHPPGYPLFTLLGKLFSYLPFGSVAFRVNLVSAIFDSLAAVFLGLAVLSCTGTIWAAVFSAGLFAFSPLIWTYATAAEVFALNNFFIALLVWLGVRFLNKPTLKWFYLSSFFVGLALSNHHTFVFLGGPVLLWMAWKIRRELFQLQTIAKMFSVFLLGLSPYLYLPITALKIPVIGWGDPSSLEGFIQHFLRRDYGTFQLGGSEYGEGGEFFTRIGLYFKDFFRQTFYVASVVSVLGFVGFWKDVLLSSFLRILLTATSAYLFVFCTLSNLRLDLPLHLAIQARFWQQAHTVLFFTAGLGFAYLQTHVQKLKPFLFPALSIALVAFQLGFHFKEQDQSRNKTFYEFAKNTLDSLEQSEHATAQKILLLTRGDYVTNSIRYLQLCEGYRPEVLVIDQMLLTYFWYKKYLQVYYPEIVVPGIFYSAAQVPGSFSMHSFLDANFSRFQIFVANGFQDYEKSYAAKYTIWPMGLNEQVFLNVSPPKISSWVEKNNFLFDKYKLTSQQLYSEENWEHRVFDQYWVMRYRFAERLLRSALEEKISDQKSILKNAIQTYLLIAKEQQKPYPHLFKNLGIAFQKLSEFEPEAKAKMIENWSTYVSLAPSSDGDIPVIKQAIEAARVGR